MRKHFLLLFLMALLPLAGFADNITILPANLQYYYGDPAIPMLEGDATVNMIAPVGELPESHADADNGATITVAQIAAALTFIPREAITVPYTYSYGLVLKDGYNESNIVGGKETNPLAGHTIYVSGGDGQLKILKTPLNADMIEIAAGPYVFKNAKWEPEVTLAGDVADHCAVTYGGTIQEGNADVTYDNIHAGDGLVVITANANDVYYSGSAYKKFAIGKLPLTLTSVTATDVVYTGYTATPGVQVKGKDANQTEYTLTGDDFDASFGEVDPINVGNYKVGVAATLNGNFTFDAVPAASSTYTFNVTKKPVTQADTEFAFAGLIKKTYTGAALTQEGNDDLKFNWTRPHAEEPVVSEILEHFVLSYSNNVNVGTATITVTAKEDNPQLEYVNNYSGSKSSTFSILPASIADLDIVLKKIVTVENVETLADIIYQYVGRPIQPGVNAEDGVLAKAGATVPMVAGVDYEIIEDSYVNNRNATPEEPLDNQKASFKIKGLGNYDAVDGNGDPILKTITFVINKKEIAATAVDVTTYYSMSPEKQFSASLNLVENEDIGGKFTYEVQEYAGEVWGDYEGALNELQVGTGKYRYVPTWVENPYPEEPEGGWGQGDNPAAPAEELYDNDDQVAARANYRFIESVPGAITVNAATLIIVPQDVTRKYGVNDPAQFDYKVYNSVEDADHELTVGEDFDFDAGHEPVLAREAGDNVKTTDVEDEYGYYTISVTNTNPLVEGYVKAYGYDIECRTGKFTITPYNITIKANDQTILYGSTPNLAHDFDSMVKTVVNGEETDGNLITVAFTPAQTGNQELISRESLHLGLELIDTYDGTVGPHEKVLKPTFDNPNFTATIINGNVTVLVSDALHLDLTDNLIADRIEAAADNKNHTISFEDLPMTGGKWHAMVLPFEASLVDVVSKLGTYVVVNKIKSASMDATSKEVTVNFGIVMDKIEAGVPFLIKPATDANWKQNVNETPITFTSEVVAAPIPQDKIAAIFTGVFAQGKSLKWGYDLDGKAENGTTTLKYKWLDPTRDAEGAWVRPKNNAHALTPMEAYLQLATEASGARIFVEDFENGTTAIKSLSADEINGLTTSEGWYTINGIKLQSAPVEKGVYINNGKKVVIK